MPPACSRVSKPKTASPLARSSVEGPVPRGQRRCPCPRAFMRRRRNKLSVIPLVGAVRLKVLLNVYSNTYGLKCQRSLTGCQKGQFFSCICRYNLGRFHPRGRAGARGEGGELTEDVERNSRGCDFFSHDKGREEGRGAAVTATAFCCPAAAA